MKTIIVHLLCLIACIPTLAATLEDRREQIANVEGVEAATIILDRSTKQPELKEVPGFPEWKTASIAYLVVSGETVTDNTVAVVIRPDGEALWYQRVPSILIPTVERQGPIGTEEEIISQIEQSQTIKALKYDISFDAQGADVVVAVDVSGKVVTRHFRVYKVDDQYIVKPYDSIETKEVLVR
jgi:hypothetical protein